MTRVQRWTATAALVVGIGVATAPVAFQMFHRAPLGGTMIDDFEPYMSTVKIDEFRAYLQQIDMAEQETATARAALTDGSLTDAEYATTFPMVVQLNEQWDGIRSDMTDLLDRMDANMENYRAVAALPPFDLFPWFFVLPGVGIAGIAASILLASRSNRPPRRRWWALVAFGAGMMLAPAAFQMFTRAPMGRDMIDDFRPMMTRTRVQNVQRYFITLGAAEGQMRIALLPAVVDAGADADSYSAIDQFSATWPTIVGDFNPMIATMSDNVDNFQAVDAMPRFDLFPWFFVVPGALVAGLAGVALRRDSRSLTTTERSAP